MAGGGGGVTYWYDACEDDDDDGNSTSLLCGIDFAASADFDPGLMPALDSGVDDGFVAEIDRILESINAETAPAPPPQPSVPVAPPPQQPSVPVAPQQPQPQPPREQQQRQEAAVAVADNALAVARPGQRSQAVEPRKDARRESHGSSANGDRDCRGGKRPRLVSGPDRLPRPDPRRRPMLPPAPRGWEERRGRRDFDRPHKRDRDSRSGHHDQHRREARGFWERDRGGKMVFRPGTWEQEESGREAKRARTHNGASVEKKAADADATAQKEKPVTEEHARQYQLEVLEQAKTRNTIAFLETGAGKTLIAVLLIKSICDKMLKENKKILAVFLVPKVPLVYQQAEVIRDRTGYRVGHYCGEMGQDFWDTRKWQREFDSKQVLVMTAQILLNILRHSIIKMDAIHLLILDECHHAVKKHPYSLVMSEFYHTTPKDKRPVVFGMTASPVNLKGVSSQEDCAIKIRNLETKLDSIVCTIKDRKELEKHVPMPLEVVVQYDKAAILCSLHDKIKQMEAEVEEAALSSSKRTKWQFMGARDAGSRDELRLVYGVSERTESDGAANLFQKLRAINYALGELGQWCAYKVGQSFLTALQSDERANYQVDVKFQESYLKKVVDLLHCQLTEGAAVRSETNDVEMHNAENDNPSELEDGELPDSHAVSVGEHVDEVIGAAVADGKVTPRVQALIKILLRYQHTKDFRAIIFVERVVTALVLPKVLAELPSLSFIRCASLIGHNNNQEMRTSQMQDTIAKFRDGRVTLLVATSVAEEGLDIRQCNVVIRFDLAKTVLAYIQSRGRARKPGSDYILMVERGNLPHETFLRNCRNSEETLRKEAIERSDLSHIDSTLLLNPIDTSPDSMYQVESTGAVVSLNSAVGLVHFYCSQLPSDRYSILRPEFIMQKHEKPGGSVEYSCKLQLPCNAPFEKLEGPICSSIRLAQQVMMFSLRKFTLSLLSVLKCE